MSSRLFLGALLITSSLAGCASQVSIGQGGGGGGGGGPTTLTCKPAETRACFGPSECLGFQSCAADGMSWSNCNCAPSMGTGSVGSCPGAQTSCAGQCVDPTSDPANCGYCGHNCQGGACQAGACQPVLVASGQDGVRVVAVDEENVYWTTPGGNQTVMKLPLGGGGTPIMLAGSQGQPFGLALDATSVYWVNTTGSVMKVGKDGGVPTQLSAGPYGGEWIAVNEASAYWTVAEGGGVIMKVGKGGGTATTIASNQLVPQSLAIDATRAYWTTEANTVASVPLAGGPASVLFAAQPSHLVYDSIAVDATSLYFVSPVQQDGSGNIMKLPLGGGAPSPIMSYINGWGPNMLAVDGGIRRLCCVTVCSALSNAA